MRHSLYNDLCALWIVVGPIALATFAVSYYTTRVTRDLIRPW
jgi:hypothetical protein